MARGVYNSPKWGGPGDMVEGDVRFLDGDDVPVLWVDCIEHDELGVVAGVAV